MIKLIAFDLWNTLAYRDKQYTLHLFPHTLPLLSKVRDLGIKTALVSNSMESSLEQLKQGTDLFQLLDYLIFSYEVGFAKPDPQIYLALVKKSGLKPDEILMIGDRVDNDVEAPRAAGLHAIRFINYKSLKSDLKRFGIDIGG